MESLLRDIRSNTGSLKQSGIFRGTADDLKKELALVEDSHPYMIVSVDDKVAVEQVRLARQLIGLNVTDTAKLLDISVSYLSRLENQDADVSAKLKYKLLNLCNFNIT